MNQLSETDKAYLAGLLDGEGCIHIRKQITKYTPTPHYSLHVIIVQSDGVYLKYWQKKVASGSIYKRPLESMQRTVKEEYRNNVRISFSWTMSSKAAGIFLQAILPYLFLKKSQAQIAIDFQSTMDASKNGGSAKGQHGGAKVPSSVLAKREECYQRVHALNQHIDQPDTYTFILEGDRLQPSLFGI